MAKRESHLTEVQAKWMTSLRAGLEAETGRTVEQWAEIARACPETKPRARQQWLKTHHGLGQNRAMLVLSEAFPDAARYDDQEGLKAALWSDPAVYAIFEAVAAAACAAGEVTQGARKGFTSWSRRVQFAAARPLKGGGVLLGLAVPPEADGRLGPVGRESWSERLKSTLRLQAPGDIDQGVRSLLQQAYDAA